MCKLLHNTNMMSFIGYINNAVIKLLINFNLHMCIVILRKSLLCDFMYLYRTVGHTNIKMFTLFLYILIF